MVMVNKWIMHGDGEEMNGWIMHGDGEEMNGWIMHMVMVKPLLDTDSQKGV